MALITLLASLTAQAPADETATPSPTATLATPTATATAGPLPPAAAVDVQAIVCAYDWSCDEALLVIYGPTPPNPQAPQGCGNGESGGIASAVGAGSVGLMQIQVEVHVDKVSRVVGRPVTFEEAWTLLLDPVINVATGWLVYEAAGYTWVPWSCRP